MSTELRTYHLQPHHQNLASSIRTENAKNIMNDYVGVNNRTKKKQSQNKRSHYHSLKCVQSAT